MISLLKTWKKTDHKMYDIGDFSLLDDCPVFYIDQTTHTEETKHHRLPLKNTGVYVPRGKDKLLIVSGESWTYGDSLFGIKSHKHKDNLEKRICNIFSGRVAQYLNADLLLKAIPGANNSTITENLGSMINCIQEHPNFKNYKEIYIIAQLTSPGRDYFKGKDLGKDITNPKFNDWFKLREKSDFDELTGIAKELPNAKICIWKNFSDFINDYEVSDTQTYIKKSWSNYTLNCLGENDIELPMINEPEKWQYMVKEVEIFKNISNVTTLISKELDKLETSWKVLHRSPINDGHPNEISHFLWAMNIIQQTNWKKDNRKTIT